MEIITISGGRPLNGQVKISGAKNAALPIMAAAILAGEPVVLEDVPRLIDVSTMVKIIRSLGGRASIHEKDERIIIDGANINQFHVPAELVSKMRASFLILGPLLARFRKVCISLPGGCAIGVRPIDLHWKGLAALGAEFTVGNGHLEAVTTGLKGNRIYLDYPSVGATENIMTAAVMAEGVTVIENAAVEPEIVDLANFLSAMGGRISGAGTSTLKIEGVRTLTGTRHQVIPDRIEAGTFMIAAALCKGRVRLMNVVPEHMIPLTAKLKETGAKVFVGSNEDMIVEGADRPSAVDIKTLPYPGFPTDLQPQFTVLLSLARGVGMLSETVFENRFRHVEELVRMGADIKVEGRSLIIQGRDRIYGSAVRATDLRAGAALVLAGLAAEGETEVSGTEHLDRGYSSLDKKLNSLGAIINRYSKITGRSHVL